MTADSGTSPDLLAAEIAAIEDLLMNYEDWRAWAQLEARERQGELPPSVAASGLKTLLLDKLAVNPLFLRRQALVKQLEQVNAQVRAKAASPDEGDDLTRIRGVDARMERRLNNLAVRNYAQIAGWTPLDVNYFASTLGLGDLIASQMWIEQATVLAGLPLSISQPPAPAPLASEDARAAASVAHPVSEIKQQASAPSQPVRQVVELGTVPDPEAASAPPAPTPRAATGMPASEKKRDELKPVSGQQPVQAVPAPAEKKAAAEPAAPVARVPEPPGETASPAVVELTMVKVAAEKERPTTPAPVTPAPVVAAAEGQKGTHAPAVGSAHQPEAPITELPAEPSYPLGAPAAPLRASAYAGYIPEPPSPAPAESPAGPVKAAALVVGAEPLAPVPHVDASQIVPAWPLPARVYSGAIAHPPHDLPAVAAIPRPLPASRFAPAPGTQKAAVAQAAADKPVSEIIESSLPPLPLAPSKPAEAKAAPPPPAPAPASAPVPVVSTGPAPPPPVAVPEPVAAAARAAAAAASVSRAPALPAATQPVAAQVAIKSPEDMLRAAEMRARAAASAPPPLPRSATPSSAPSTQPAARAVIIDEDGPQRIAAPEARVSIRRSEDAPASPVIKVPGATDVHLSRRTPETFDGNSYAAYHTEVEEASVQIVRKGPPRTHAVPPAPPVMAPVSAPPAATPPPVRSPKPAPAGPASKDNTPPPAPAAPTTAAEAAARAAAALSASAQAARAAAQVAAGKPGGPPPMPAPAPEDPMATAKKSAEKAAQTMGRFLKALTGQ